MTKPTLGIGSCLIGEPVRFNGDSKKKNPHIEALKQHLTFSSFCPEVAIGMGVPRETVRLVGDLAELKIMDSHTQSKDYTSPMQDYARQVHRNHPELAGYILVKGSPSCGYDRVKRYNHKGNSQGNDAMGIFAAQLRAQNPLLPMEEDGRLNDHALRENFIGRVFAYHDWQQLNAAPITHHQLITFWSRYKYMVMAHHIGHYKAIGRLLANHHNQPLAVITDEFISLLMQALEKLATRQSNTNVLEHLRGYLKKQMNASDKKELGTLIEQYRNGTVPLIVPLTLLRHHFKHKQNAYIDQQVFISPYPEQLSLRNHI